MSQWAFETVDVFASQQFRGNPLAVFPDARGMSETTMQALAKEFNLSESAFVLPPNNPANTARVRIFNRTSEMAFAGHPCIGTAYALASKRQDRGHVMRFEVPAGVVAIEIELDHEDRPVGAKIESPQVFQRGEEVPPSVVSSCLGLQERDLILTHHAPLVGSTGNPYVFAEVSQAALAQIEPDVSAFREALAARTHFNSRFSIHVYARVAGGLRARMFAPLSGTWEDPATGSANAPLAGLLLSLGSAKSFECDIEQGVEMGRPSQLRVSAQRTSEGIKTTVAGNCVPVLSGLARINEKTD